MSETQHVLFAKTLKSAQQIASNINEDGKKFAILNNKPTYTKILTSSGTLNKNKDGKYYEFDIKVISINNDNEKYEIRVDKSSKLFKGMPTLTIWKKTNNVNNLNIKEKINSNNNAIVKINGIPSFVSFDSIETLNEFKKVIK